LLKRVSRSFYLSMRWLPKPMREPISLGYLLARASDTLADTAEVPVALRRQCLDEFRASFAEARPGFPEFYARVMREFTPRQSHQGERELLQLLPEVFDWLAASGGENREAVTAVLEEIAKGQSWDLERFGGEKGGGMACCETAEELETYTWRVAGCVGEFWTRVGTCRLGARFAPAEVAAELMEEGRGLGRGLQLVNILRDLGEDLRQGRCYLPRTELIAAGWDAEAEDRPPEAVLMEVAAAWRERCRAELSLGRKYVARLRRGRVRAATALPLILAEATLDKIEAAGAAVLREKVKVDRSEVRRAMWRAVRA